MSGEKLTTNYIRDLYNTEIPKRFQHYEFERWFSSMRSWADYVMTYKSLWHHLQTTSFISVLELGPGPGTWTRLLFRKNQEAQIDCLDISEMMHKEFRAEMREGGENVTYTTSDFSLFEPKRTYDLFFSSRAIEYFPDKDIVVAKIAQVLNPKGKGIILTKNASHGKDNRLQHSAQITPDDFTQLLEKYRLHVEGVFPCVIRIPFLDRISVYPALRLFNKVFKSTPITIPNFLVESFVTVFSK